MPMYYEGYSEAREIIRKMSDEELLGYLDDMYGRDNLPENYTHEDLVNEALDHCRRDFTDTSSPEYEQVQFYKKLHQAMRAG